MNPTVTIIMATYNRAHFIAETLKTIQMQSYNDWECLIIDDGGTDNTQEVIASILEKDNRFQFLKRPDSYKKGLPGSRNFGLDIAKGDFIIFFDDDDIIHPDNLKLCLQVIKNNNVDFCHYQKEAFCDNLPIIKDEIISQVKHFNRLDIEKIVTQEIGFASCTVMWNKQCFAAIRFNESLLYAEEWECYLRLITNNVSGVIINNILYFNRKHPNSNTGEFYNNDPVRRASKKDAILLVIQSLKDKQLLSPSLIKYFIQIAVDYKEYNLFHQILNILKLSIFEKIRWAVFFNVFSVRLYLYKLRKKNKNIY
jgi:GalNAc5-diNAcBac-PP-undecaprenol beta-1,3-glucosyltransferase